jgi:type II secretory pathway pseudopilin PulG
MPQPKIKNVLSPRHGLSLVEIMIAMVMTLIVLGAMMAAFSYGSAEMQKGRASIELNNRLITAEEQLRRDLDRITVDLKPYHKLTTLPKGYVEIVDGAQTDYVPGNDATFEHGGNEMILGDRDDFFACTIKSEGQAFRGRRDYTRPTAPLATFNDVVESHLAEVAWFTVFNSGTPELNDVLTIRRQLLILPSLGNVGLAADYDTFIQNNDISVRIEGPFLVANSISDLAIRGNRFSHSLPAATNPASSILETVPLGVRYNDNHIMFSSVAAFDVQVFAPDASVRVVPNGAADDIQNISEPFDIGSEKAGSLVGTPAVISGAYVDLGKGIAGSSGVLGGPMANSIPPYSPPFFVYDTGTSQYNRDSPNDLGSNGVDDDGDGVIDNAGEENAAGTASAVLAPYDTPIRGLKFTMRVLEPKTKQVRQLTVKKSFVAQ